MGNWTTRIQPELTRQYGVEELHDACFIPHGWPGKGTTVSLGLPECELHLCILAKDGTPVISVNRPATNFKVRYWMRYACKLATDNNAAIFFNCDTAEQAEFAAKRAAKLLPKHKRIPLERMYDPATRADVPLH